eukprot:5403304-Amphidinium_carterae.1
MLGGLGKDSGGSAGFTSLLSLAMLSMTAGSAEVRIPHGQTSNTERFLETEDVPPRLPNPKVSNTLFQKWYQNY